MVPEHGSREFAPAHRQALAATTAAADDVLAVVAAAAADAAAVSLHTDRLHTW